MSEPETEKKSFTLQERLDAQIQATQQLYNLWQQSQGAVTMLQELIKEQGETNAV